MSQSKIEYLKIVCADVREELKLQGDVVKRMKNFNSSDGRVVRASASEAIDLGLIPSRVKPMTLDPSRDRFLAVLVSVSNLGPWS